MARFHVGSSVVPGFGDGESGASAFLLPPSLNSEAQTLNLHFKLS